MFVFNFIKFCLGWYNKYVLCDREFNAKNSLEKVPFVLLHFSKRASVYFKVFWIQKYSSVLIDLKDDKRDKDGH